MFPEGIEYLTYERRTEFVNLGAKGSVRRSVEAILYSC